MNKIFLLLLFLQCNLCSWADVGHEEVARLAYRRLEPRVAQEVDRLAATLEKEYPEHATFVTLSTWLDKIRLESGGVWEAYHYTNLVFDPENCLSREDRQQIEAANEGKDIVFAIRQAARSLNRPVKDHVQVLMLAIALHTIADIHQPLHCTTRYSRDFPLGDRGGTLTRVDSPLAKNLHIFWDLGFGDLVDEESIEDFRPLFDLVDPEVGSMDPYQWAKEGRLLAEIIAYPLVDEFGQIQQDRLAEAREVVAERLVLASIRLANFLNTHLHL